MIALVDESTSEYLGSPDVPADATLTAPDGQELGAEASFVWTVPNEVGIYLIPTTFEQAGTWWVTLKASGMAESMQASFIVGEGIDPMPGVGDPAISVATRTSADHPIEELSTDDEPEPSFYTTSLDVALTSGEPTVVVFATPAFCVSQTCGPMLDHVKAVASAHPDATYVHVEIYENAHIATADNLQLDPAVTAWGLPSEPWVFVVDRNGMVAARFEGVLAEGELEEALSAVGA